MTMDNSVAGAFRAMKEAYEKFLRESEKLQKEITEHRMTLPPTLGTIK